MTQRVVDAAPLLFLARIGPLPLLQLGVDRVLVPSAVLREIRRKPDPVLAPIESTLGFSLHECTALDQALLRSLNRLGEGEREVIAQAVALQAVSVVLDDMDARRAARRDGLTPLGTVGLLLAGKSRGLLPAVRPELERLRSTGAWISDVLWNEALREAGEDSG